MKICLFYHSLVSDWNHGNAHFLRGVAGELISRGHQVNIYEPRDSWSRENLVRDHGNRAINNFHAAYPNLRSHRYDLAELNLNAVLQDVDLVIAHEWNDPKLISMLGRHRHKNGGYKLIFHDTHHRGVTAPEEMSRFDLRHYDGALVFGKVLEEIYRAQGWADTVWTWHEAADAQIFKPLSADKKYDLVWIGNWGDNERTAELHEYLLQPIKELSLKAIIYGVRYPEEALTALKDARIEYGGWLPNYKVPELFAQARVTVHVPRRPYVLNLPGIPTIRPFEAMACGIPLISSPWKDAEGLFNSNQDYLSVNSGKEMATALRSVLDSPARATQLARSARETILSRHTCAHRVDELIEICRQIGARNLSTETSTPREAVA